jgi:hypothetical protein
MRRPRQLELALHRGKWGGYRPGAGRAKTGTLRMPHLTRAPFAAAHTCHVTVKVREGIASLRRRDVVREV